LAKGGSINTSGDLYGDVADRGGGGSGDVFTWQRSIRSAGVWFEHCSLSALA